MEDCGDFVQWLGLDMSMKIIISLEDPSDLVRVSSVSKYWRQFVIANGLSKRLCLRIFPELSSLSHVIEVKNKIEPVEVRPGNSMGWECLEREHRVYAFLARGLTPSMRKDCISEVIRASSTDNYPEESIQNTLEPSDRVGQRASYWSSKGESDPAVPETTYVCISAYFQFELPIYSAKAVRFRMGQRKTSVEIGSNSRCESEAGDEFTDSSFLWTYISPEFPMAQENCLQKFKLPEPVLCIGGILQIELLGRVQRQEMDGLYYICISHVQVVGRTLSLPFEVETLDPSGSWALKYCPKTELCQSPPIAPEGEASEPSGFKTFATSVRGWEQMILSTLLGNRAMVIDDDDDDDDSVN
ncbi:F-box protein [Actinidia chinensis var. chinensis]|uniref:F-box protein n=1 Tax=Actinidia chinensis var. chinensis TaxID=1590841 RepID=A0A2R6RWD1_ACTCC|nr:F-box protein [Actinidia chinensis var. chinensis]